MQIGPGATVSSVVSLSTPTIQYARSGGASIAYQAIGEGSVDLLLVSGWLTQIEQLWELAPSRRYIERLAEFSRVLLFDPRGSGASDDTDDAHTLELDVQDALAVLDAAGSERGAVFTKWMGGPVGALLAANHPERVVALVMFASLARATWAPDYEWALTSDQRDALVDQSVDEWGEGGENREAARWAPSATGDPAMAAWLSRMQRGIASPGR